MGLNTADDCVDVVVSFVDPTDPAWQKRYKRATGCGNAKNHVRFRCWDNLNYLLRGIEVNMPWTRRVYLVVQSESQIPKWLNRENERLRIVFHSDYIPAELLPSFNTNSIELFLHRIPDIAEKFVVFNDDVFAVKLLSPDNFFDGEKARISQVKGLFKADCQYRRMLLNNIRLLKRDFEYSGFKPDHITHNILKSAMAEIIESNLKEVINRLKVSPERDERNLTIQLVKDYIILTGKAAEPNIEGVYVHLADGINFLHYPYAQVVCYNDTDLVVKEYGIIKSKLNSILRTLLPKPSAFEHGETNGNN